MIAPMLKGIFDIGVRFLHNHPDIRFLYQRCNFSALKKHGAPLTFSPAAISTLQAHFRDLRRVPSDYDLIVTGDLGMLGRTIVLDQFRRIGVDLSPVYNDCGLLIFDTKSQDVHAGAPAAGAERAFCADICWTGSKNGSCGGFCSARRARCSPPRPAGRANRSPACATQSPSRRKEYSVWTI